MSESKIVLKRTANEIFDFIEKWKSSGLTKKEFCLNERLNYQTFMGWMGRRNYLFAGSHKAAQRAAMIYSFFAMCKYHNLNPHHWLKDTLARIPETKMSELSSLMPSSK